MDKGTITIREEYTTAQTDTVLDTPSSSKRFVIWGAILKSPEGIAEVKFTNSGDIIISGAGDIGSSNIGGEGEVGESISITCPANTTIALMYDEL